MLYIIEQRKLTHSGGAKMKRIIRWLLPGLLILALAGCAQLFEFNLFKALDLVRLPSAEQLQKMPVTEALDYLEEELGSPSFVDKLSEDPEAKEEISGYLSETMNDPSVPPEEQRRAAVLYADLHLKTTPAEELVNNVANLITGAITTSTFDETGGAEDFFESFIEAIVPPEALSDRELFDQMLEGFQEAWTGYEAFGNSINGDPPPPATGTFEDPFEAGAIISILEAAGISFE